MRITTTIKKIITKITGYEIEKKPPAAFNQSVVHLKPAAEPVGNVLLAYFTEPFLLPEGSGLLRSHAHFEESRLIANTFLNMGYAVDVIDYRNTVFPADKQYAYFVSARTNFELYANKLNSGCVKIAHMDMAHWLFNNPAAYNRCVNVLNRRGTALASISKIQEFNWAIEHADYAVVLGNSFTRGTYEYANKPIYTINNISVVEFESPENKDFDKIRNTFIWLGSDGIIHKGLDIALEAFSGLPDHKLIVCGPIAKDKRFEREYAEELYNTESIITHGWVDVGSDEFVSVCNNSLGIMYPSASEGQAGSVVTCMHAGLIPVISYESGIDVGDHGVILNDCSVDSMRREIIQLSDYPVETLKTMAMKTWQSARNNFSREYYKKKHKEIIEAISNDNTESKKTPGNDT